MFTKRVFATIMAACVICAGASGSTVSGAAESVEMAQEATTDTYDTTGGIGGIMVPVYEGSRHVASYLINPENARSGLQRIFDWSDYRHRVEGSSEQIRVELPRATYRIHAVTSSELDSFKSGHDPEVGHPASYLALYSKTTLDMKSGATLALDKDQRSDCLMRFGRIDEPASGYDTFTDINITGGTFDGSNTTHPLLRFAHSQNVTVSGCRFTNLFKQHHFEFAGCKNVTVDGCTFDRYRSDNLGSGNNHEALQLDVLTEGAFPGAGIGGYDGTSNIDITVKNCTFKHCKRGIGTHTGIVGLYQKNITIQNNTFTNVIGYAIASINWNHARIEGNTISGGRGIYFKHLSGANHRKYMPNIYGKAGRITPECNSVISNNKITIKKSEENRYHFGISTFGEVIDTPFEAMNSKGETSFIDASGQESTYGMVPAGDYRVKGLLVKNNNITAKCKTYGILLRGTVTSKITSNHITNASGKSFKKGAGIWDASGASNKIVKNTITDNSHGLASYIVISKTMNDRVRKNIIADNKADSYELGISRVSLSTNSANALLQDDGIKGATEGMILENVVQSADRILTENKPDFGIVSDRTKGLVVSGNYVNKGKKESSVASKAATH